MSALSPAVLRLGGSPAEWTIFADDESTIPHTNASGVLPVFNAFTSASHTFSWLLLNCWALATFYKSCTCHVCKQCVLVNCRCGVTRKVSNIMITVSLLVKFRKGH